MARTKMQEEEPVEKVLSSIPLRTKRLQKTFSMGKTSSPHHYLNFWIKFLRLCGHFLDFSRKFAYLALPGILVSHQKSLNDSI